MAFMLLSLLACVAWANANPISARTVHILDEPAAAEAQRRDDTAVRAFSNIQIKTSDGKCLYVDKPSGDFRANLLSIQVAKCGSTEGQGWDIITAGKHIKGDDVMLVVNTLTRACLDFNLHRPKGSQAFLYPCDGFADGSGEVADSQLFVFDGRATSMSLKPVNAKESCLAAKDGSVDIIRCQKGDTSQVFTFGLEVVHSDLKARGNFDQFHAAGRFRTSTTSTAAAAETSDSEAEANSSATSTARAQSTRTTTLRTTIFSTTTSTRQKTSTSQASAQTTRTSTLRETVTSVTTLTSGSRRTRVRNRTKTRTSTTTTSAQTTTAATTAATTSAAAASGIPTVNPTTPVPVSLGGLLQPSAAAKAHQRDNTATRAFENVEIRAPNGQCMFVDPTAGDFRQNLIPVSLVKCSGSPNEKWDVIVNGKHNQPSAGRPNSALVVSSLTQGCISFDGRRQQGDRVFIFSCGGRADGSGGTDGNQLFPYLGQTSFAFAPLNAGNTTCILPGDGRLTSGPCPTDGSQLFSIFL